MRKATVLTIAAVLALPAIAHAKGAIVSWDRYPEQAKLGETIGFTLMVPPMHGRRPLVTFRSHSGRVVRVRTTRADLNGIAYGEVAFPDKGPWGTEVHAGTRTVHTPDSIPFKAGVGLTQLIPAATAAPAADARRAADPPAGLPWAWLIASAAAGSVLILIAIRRRGRHWGAA